MAIMNKIKHINLIDMIKLLCVNMLKSNRVIWFSTETWFILLSVYHKKILELKV
jgi:hypothetical protein